VGPEMIDRVIEALDLKANSSWGANNRSMVNFSFFFTVPNSFEIFRKGKE
jgi:hypothetical protein